MADARKTLEVLYNEWSDCKKCALGERRITVNGQIVFGEGRPRGILFVGEGPGRTEEEEGRPFVGKSGEILRRVLGKLGVNEVYITNTVCCRSAAPLIDQVTNTPMLRKNRETGKQEFVWKDEPPIPPYVEACKPRLHEEIYLVDPVIIVSLGGGAASALTGSPITITNERGKERHIGIPGATFRASLTDKKGVWRRKVRGEIVQPVELNEVRYLLLPTFHPAYIARKLGDKGATSPFRLFVDDIKKAVKIFERYTLEVFGSSLSTEDVSDGAIEELHEQLEEGPEDDG